jgi:penicillin-binding protein 1A
MKAGLRRVLFWGVVAAAGSAAALLCAAGIAVAVIYPNLPDVSELSDYRPKLPLRVFTSDGVLIGEFGEERRNLTPIADIPGR